ncbi:hypothetical protein PILCRDRAFT_734751 [Piloderma croceum F 1598]|uniref:Uncharacterized protein n=1 Tax=Piloderma croceum (strain F 1598) TaxID=765440 RepID=A0A0C3EZ77_PILCF|nr:hypothetical protein PILCRDRAFT_734751 [Piloderma croceum F 1598]
MYSISNDFSHLSVGDLHASSEPSTTAVLARISVKRDDFTDEDHRPLDAKIMSAFSAFRKLNEEPDLSELLSRITTDKRLTWLKPDEAEELLDREPSIASVLRNGWQAGSFKAVRQLAILWPEVQEQPKRSVVTIEQQDDPSLRVQSLATEFSWTREYIGDASVELWNHIKNHYGSNEQVYANYLAIVQSSGMGKSRTVDEMSKRHFVIPMNLREADSTGRFIGDHLSLT